METPIYNRYSHNWAKSGGDLDDSTEHKQEAMPTRPQSLQLPTPAPSASRWSHTTCSLSVYEDDGFNDDGTTLREVMTGAPSPDTAAAHSKEKKKVITRSRAAKVLGALLIIGALVAVIIVFIKTFSSRKPGEPMPAPTSYHKTATPSVTNLQQSADLPSITASHYSTDQPSVSHLSISQSSTSQSSTAAVVQVSTQVIRTTVGTLTESAFSNSTTT